MGRVLVMALVGMWWCTSLCADAGAVSLVGELVGFDASVIAPGDAGDGSGPATRFGLRLRSSQPVALESTIDVPGWTVRIKVTDDVARGSTEGVVWLADVLPVGLYLVEIVRTSGVHRAFLRVAGPVAAERAQALELEGALRSCGVDALVVARAGGTELGLEVRPDGRTQVRLAVDPGSRTLLLELRVLGPGASHVGYSSERRWLPLGQGLPVGRYRLVVQRTTTTVVREPATGARMPGPGPRPRDPEFTVETWEVVEAVVAIAK